MVQGSTFRVESDWAKTNSGWRVQLILTTLICPELLFPLLQYSLGFNLGPPLGTNQSRALWVRILYFNEYNGLPIMDTLDTSRVTPAVALEPTTNGLIRRGGSLYQLSEYMLFNPVSADARF